MKIMNSADVTDPDLCGTLIFMIMGVLIFLQNLTCWTRAAIKKDIIK